MHIDIFILGFFDQYVLLAQAADTDLYEKFMTFIKPILSIVTTVMVLWCGLLIHDGKVREGAYAGAGAVIIFMARLMVSGMGN